MQSIDSKPGRERRSEIHPPKSSAVAAVDPVRRAGLTSIVWTAGHAVNDGVNDADVVLADGVSPGAGQPTVTLG